MTNKKTSKVPLQCKHCLKKFKYESEKKRHELSHVSRFRCKVCAKKFSFMSSLHRHEKQHDRTDKVKCEECGGLFRDEILLKRHKNYAHKELHECSKCNTSCNSQSALRSHMKIHKPKEERKYKCYYDGCNKTFNFVHHLKHHELTHENIKQYYCDTCDKGFIQLHHLKTHLKSHDPDKWIVCSINGCMKRFPNEYARKRHMATCKIRTDDNVLCDSNTNKSTVSENNSFHDKEYDFTLSNTNHSTLKNKQSEDRVDILNLNVSYNTENQVNGHLSLDEESIEVIETAKVNEINSCKTVLGGCLSDDSESNCLCAKMTSQVEEPCDLITIFDEPSKLTQDYNAYDNAMDCESCECAAFCKGKNSNVKDACLKRINLNYAMPSIQYVNGVVKLKEAFDFGDPSIAPNDETERLDVFEDNIVGPYVLKSCEAALGKCIVNGNGTNGAECLCAKMMITERVTAEEIDDITPQPNNIDIFI